jgi:hypothetical protein
MHRVAGVLLIGAGVYHVFYLALTREGRRLIRDFAPTPKDAFDAWGTMLYYLGLSKRSRSSAASATRRRRSTGRWSGARR